VTTVYERLDALRIKLPESPPPVVDGYAPRFVPFVRTGNLVYVSGRLAKMDGKPYAGKLGQQVTTAEGRQAARDVAIEVLATLQTALGDLEKVTRIVTMTVLVNSAPDFTESHEVANGASILLCEVFGDRGAHTRTTVGAAQIPFGACLEIEMIVEVAHSNGESQMGSDPAGRV
jgi:enamine deaminase RidA (YjgF/YER057c/UK114 family)